MSDDVRAHEIAEQRMAAALRESDPVAALVVAAADPALTDDLRAAFAQADPDGVRMAALLIVKLRFERLIRGSERARAWFEREPASFAETFRRYHAEVAPKDFWPSEEAARFDAWTARQQLPES